MRTIRPLVPARSQLRCARDRHFHAHREPAAVNAGVLAPGFTATGGHLRRCRVLESSAAVNAGPLTPTFTPMAGAGFAGTRCAR